MGEKNVLFMSILYHKLTKKSSKGAKKMEVIKAAIREKDKLFEEGADENTN